MGEGAVETEVVPPLFFFSSQYAVFLNPKEEYPEHPTKTETDHRPRQGLIF